jgi:DNA-binding beta-propeller fold protein YncE
MGRRLGKPARRGLTATLWVALAALLAPTAAQAAFDDPLFAFSPEPPPGGSAEPEPPPNGYLNGPCGLAVDSGGRFYLSDHYHGAVDVFTGARGYLTQASEVGPCGLAVDNNGNLYVNGYHRDVVKYAPAVYPPGLETPYSFSATIDTDDPTGVAVDPATDRVYVNNRTHVSVYEAAGNPVLDGGGQPLRIGQGTLAEGYGLAVSAFPATAGLLYVPDAATDTVKVYDPAADPLDPIATIAGPPGGFGSLRDSAVAVDRVSGDLYVLDNTQPAHAEQPEGIVWVFASNGAQEGHLKYKVVHGVPSGLAVDNSSGPTQGRVYVTSGNTHHGGIYAYPPGAATNVPPQPPTIPPPPLGGGLADPRIEIGKAASGPDAIACEGDACQSLPPEPVDPTLTTLLGGLGNPKVRYRRALRDCGPLLRTAHRAARAAKRAERPDPKLAKRARRAARAAKRCQAANGGEGKPSAAASAIRAGQLGAGATGEGQGGPSTAAKAPGPPAAPGPRAAAAPPIATGLTAGVWDERGEPATLAGSHPYEVELGLGLDQSAGAADLRELALQLPPGLLANPAALPLCQPEAFATPRPAPSLSGESCPNRTQAGTLEIESSAPGAAARRFGLFHLRPPDGVAARFGASPYGAPIFFDAQLRRDPDGSYGLALGAAVDQSLDAAALRVGLWGAPWDASHNPERGGCLNETEPDFALAKCSVGEPLQNRPLAFLTMPTRCGAPLVFGAGATTWQGGTLEAQAQNREQDGDPALLTGCEQIGFAPHTEGLLSTAKASSPTGFLFRLANEDPGLTDPRARIRSLVRRAVVELPEGATLNPSLGAGLEACEPAQYEAESAFTAHGAGCPNGAKIGDFLIRTPFYEGFLRGGLYLAAPRRNPFDSLIAVYLVAKSAERGLLVKAAGELVPDPSDGTLTAVFEDLPQLPYAEMQVSVRSGQRAPLVSPPRCGAAVTRTAMSPWAGPSGAVAASTETQIVSGIDAGPCPDGSVPPFAPGAIAGGVNSNVGSYTPYFVHLIRRDTEQEIASYSLVLPKGIVGKLAGIPFCPDAAIAAARDRGGFAETASPSCPAASQVGRTLTGYGVGAALTYAPGRIYLAGPYKGQPLSLVTINAATVGPFDLGTIAIRSAFSVNERTAQLAIDSRASDPIPHILQGIPLHLRDIRVYMDRPEFTRNPTGCEASEMISTLTGSGARFEDTSDDSSATVAKHFQLLNCLTLDFRPRLGLNLVGGTRRGEYPGLRAVFRARPQDASLKRIAVTMPRALFLAQNHIRTVCTRVEFAAERCPPGSVYGRAAANTPLFDEPLRGSVYLRSSDNKLPDLVASLRSGEVRIVLEGQIGPSQGGGIRAFFDNLPDAPVDRFTMWLNGGQRGLLVNSVNVCASPPSASVKALAQNNRGAIFTTKLRGKCNKRGGRG